MTIYFTHRYKELKLASHELLESAIGDYISDRERASVLVSRLKRDDSHEYEGKPYIEGFSKFSISHSDNSWAVLICSRECGLDIQYERSCDFIGISRRFFNAEDAAMVAGIYGNESKAYQESRYDFFECWTKREALVKAAGLSVVDENCPPVALHSSAVYNGVRYYIGNIQMPGAEQLHAAISIDATFDIDEKLIYKEMYVKK